MRRLAFVAVFVVGAACSKKPGNPGVIDAPPIDASTTADASAIDAAPRSNADAVVATCTPVHGTKLSTVMLAQGLDSPIYVTSPAGDRRLFVIEQPGRIRIIENGSLLPQAFLDISADSGGPVQNAGNEQGLLGLAFHPQYATNGRFYVHYTVTNGDSVIVEYTDGTDPYKVDPKTSRLLVTIPHPTAPPEGDNHNSGSLEFGPDGFLYFTVGDGGGGGDPNNNAQNLTKLLGKMSRIDVDSRTGSKPYGIPPSNPYASSADGASDPRPELWSLGWRNPYRWDFDPATGDQYVADVGQNLIEEVDVIPHGTGANANYGWHQWEGAQCYTAGCTPGGFTMPQVTHTHAAGWCAIIGGAVYRGSCFPDLDGQYIYTDYCLAQAWAFTPNGTTAPTDDHAMAQANFPATPTSLHTDALGELYVTSRDGTVRHIIAGP
jgi:glucose/arabinose dehydrogenase